MRLPEVAQLQTVTASLCAARRPSTPMRVQRQRNFTASEAQLGAAAYSARRAIRYVAQAHRIAPCEAKDRHHYLCGRPEHRARLVNENFPHSQSALQSRGVADLLGT